MNRHRRVLLLSPLCLAAACSRNHDQDSGAAPLSPGRLLSEDTTGYPKVTEPRRFRYPADHGPHPRYKHEWWYLTGQVLTESGRRFGFQFTVFREAISPEPPDSPSKWATSQLYLAHAAVTDVAGRRYSSDERSARGGALGLAGASASPFRVWLEGWKLSGTADPDGGMKVHLAVASRHFGYNLAIRNTRPPVAQGDHGMSLKGPRGNASYYYSYTDLAARGTVRVNGKSFEAAGRAWFDHEWSSSALQPDQTGWDWFSLQLSGGGALMVFRLRDESGPDHDFYSGTFIDASGTKTVLSSQQIGLKALGYWTSRRTKVRYPVQWRVSVPSLDLVLDTVPWLDDQELVHSFRYWEGAVRVTGQRGGHALTGQGYVELTGYGQDDRTSD
ncbi:MAG: lipocalin-like domain-containing protein [Arenicellales bacterium]